MTANGIIAATDGSAESLRAVEWAAREAVLRHEPLRIVSVPALPPRMSPDPADRQTVAGVVQQAASRALASAAERVSEVEPGLVPETMLLDGPPARVLTEAARDAAMLVVGSRGAGGFAALVLGSVSRYVATHARCPVVVAREETMAAHRSVVVGIGDPDQAHAAFRFGFEEAALRGARLLALHAWAWSLTSTQSAGTLTPQERAVMNASDIRDYVTNRLEIDLAAWREKYPGVLAAWELVHAQPARVLVGASARADLVVIGRHGGESPVGSVIHPVLSHAHGPVAIVPSE